MDYPIWRESPSKDVLVCTVHGRFYPQLVGHTCPDCLRFNPPVIIEWYQGDSLSPLASKLLDKEA